MTQPSPHDASPKQSNAQGGDVESPVRPRNFTAKVNSREILNVLVCIGAAVFMSVFFRYVGASSPERIVSAVVSPLCVLAAANLLRKLWASDDELRKAATMTGVQSPRAARVLIVLASAAMALLGVLIGFFAMVGVEGIIRLL